MPKYRPVRPKNVVVHLHHHINLLGTATTTKDLEGQAVQLGYNGSMYQAPGIVPVAKLCLGCIVCPLATFCCLLLLFTFGFKWICVFIPSLCGD